MNIAPTKAYVYQPHRPRPDGTYGVSGLHSLGFADGTKGLTLKDANEIARVCNDNPEFAKSHFADQASPGTGRKVIRVWLSV